MAICVSDSPDDLRWGFNALHSYRKQHNFGHRPALAEYSYHVMHGGTGRRCYDSYPLRERRQLFLVLRVKQPLSSKLCLELLIGYLQIANALWHQVGTIKLICTVTRKDRYTAKSSDTHTALRAKAKL